MKVQPRSEYRWDQKGQRLEVGVRLSGLFASTVYKSASSVLEFDYLEIHCQFSMCLKGSFGFLWWDGRIVYGVFVKCIVHTFVENEIRLLMPSLHLR
ncbi:hypothetical protein C1H46_001175 [Malus baccata]|uniref:Uncharacterized protein n=1 Tax=Malus baccata TaxID=106549 RepID=A0A540NPY6_MALBA|nr:hypothetical protein C1H46_001175 [Malus baccata]